MNNLAAVGFGCIAALALWKGTKERWFPALLGMLVIVATMKYSFKAYDESNDFVGWLMRIPGEGDQRSGVIAITIPG